MYYLLIDQRDWYDCGYDTVGSFNDRKVIEAEILPEIPYQEITDMSLQIVQSCFPCGIRHCDERRGDCGGAWDYQRAG